MRRTIHEHKTVLIMSFLVELSRSLSQKEIRKYVQMHLSLLIEVSIRFCDLQGRAIWKCMQFEDFLFRIVFLRIMHFNLARLCRSKRCDRIRPRDLQTPARQLMLFTSFIYWWPITLSKSTTTTTPLLPSRNLALNLSNLHSFMQATFSLTNWHSVLLWFVSSVRSIGGSYIHITVLFKVF